MCICINCRHVHNCTTYKIIQKQHEQDVYKSYSVFIPSQTIIKVNINTSLKSTQFDWDLIECLSFIEQPGKWLFNLKKKN
uniref:Ycf34 n=1 Tax=Riquetophycus sp. TaxID=1897556 RepID=A0A1C9C830_9FLOR|nr:hypothetical protein Riqu_066 [Riquetophycus sp.]